MVDRRRWWRLSALVAAAAMTLSSCSGSDEEPTTIATKPEGASGEVTYVGKVDASTANIGLVTQGDRLAGMVCQDAKSSLRLDAVTLANGSAELVADGKVVGTVSVAEDVAVGTVEIAGSQHRFMTEPATGQAGVYRLAAGDSDAWHGWVVLNDGTYTGTSKGKPSGGSPWINPDSQP